MEPMTQQWTDGRLDELSRKVDDGFERVDADMRALRSEVSAVQRTMVQGFIAVTGGMFAGFAVLGALIVTQL
jgi:hypothetical protein